MLFFNFLNFLAISVEFSITLHAGTKRNNNFYFHSFLAFSNLFWLEMKLWRSKIWARDLGPGATFHQQYARGEEITEDRY